MSRIENNKILPLTGIRAIAAYSVFLHHYTFTSQEIGHLLHRFLFQGYIGVSIFFVLSGFLIHHSYSDSLRFSTPWFKKYFRNRFSRIYPLYFILCLCTLLNAKETHPFSWIVNLTLLKGFSNSWKFSHVAQAWSLTVEETFYASAPLILLARKLGISLIFICTIFYSFGYGSLFLGQTFPWEGFFDSFHFVSIYTFFGRCFEFLIGILFSEMTKKDSRFPILTNHSTLVGSFGSILIVLLLATSVHKDNEAALISSTFGLVLCNWILPLFLGLLIFGLAKEKTVLARMLGSNTFVLLGKSSYAFYLLHIGLPTHFTALLGTGILTQFVSLILVSILVFLVFEDPINRLLRGQSKLFLELNSIQVVQIIKLILRRLRQSKVEPNLI